MDLVIKKRSVLPGFNLTLGYTVFYLGFIVLIPLAALFLKSFTLSFKEFWSVVGSQRALFTYWLTFRTSLAAAAFNAVFGFLLAWVLTRYHFFGRRFLDVLVDLPFALPTAVAGIALSTTYSKNGILGHYLESLGIEVVHNSIGITVALVFIGLPFVVRTVQPVLEDLDRDMEEAATCLGASRFQTFWRIIFPAVFPALLTGFTLAFARALGEYGSVVFISANKPFKTEINSLYIMTLLDQHDYPQAAAVAAVMLLFSFVLLLFINLVQWWAHRRQRGEA